MKHGVIAGKFLPPHLGHEYLINTAIRKCDQLTVLICDRPEYQIPAVVRKEWLQRIHPGVTFRIIKDTLDDNDSAAWALNTIKILGYKPDLVFSSEDYGSSWAKHMDAKHVNVDKPRRQVPISATEIRANPWSNWKYLNPVVRPYFVKRICIVGSESTGTTTLAKALAKHYKTNWVPEYGRTYTVEQKDRIDKEGWKTADFVAIAKEQNRQEDELAQTADKVLICDTDSFATAIWHERYMQTRSYETEALAAGRDYALYIITDVNIPFEQDGLRDGEHLREWMHGHFQDKLRFWGKPFVIVSGNRDERLAQATALIDKLLGDTAVTLPGIIRDAWHPAGGF